MGFIPKTHSAQRILEGLNCILKGDIYIPEEIKLELANSSQTNGAISITKRQLEVLDMMHQGLSNKQIAHQLHISEGTVKFHISNMFGIFKAQNRVDCVQSARELGFIK